MNDPGTLATEKGMKSLERRLRQVYRNAKEDIEKIISEYNLRFMAKDAEMLKKKAEGVITEEQYKS